MTPACRDEMDVDLPEPVRAPNGIRLEVVRDFNELRKHAAAWNRLVAETGCRPMMSHAWISACLEPRPDSVGTWFCLLAYDRQQLAGVLPVIAVPRRWPGGHRCLRFETPCDAFSAGTVETLLRRGYEEDVFPLFLNYLWSIPCSCCCLRFRRVPGARLPETISRRLCGKTSCIRAAEGSESLLSVTGSADDYFATLSSGSLHSYHRSGECIREQPGVHFRFETGGSEIFSEQFMALECQDRGARCAAAIRSSESQKQLFRLLTKRMEEQGWLRWAFLDIDGKPAAGQFMLQNGGILYVVKTGCDARFPNCSSGQVLFGRVIENAFESPDVQVINFMSGCPWVKDWNVQTLPVASVAFFPETFRRWGLCKQPLMLQAWVKRNPVFKRISKAVSARLSARTAV